MTPTTAPGLETRSRRALAVVLLAVALLIVASWVAWLTHRSLVAAAFCLLTARRAALVWLLAGGGAGLYLCAMDVLYDQQHGVWGKAGNGVLELAVNALTLGLSVFVLRWTWLRRGQLLAP